MPCEQLCNIGEANGCFPEGVTAEKCTQDCHDASSSSPECTGLLDTAHNCGLEALSGGGCNVQSPCASELDAMEQCIHGG
jgi:hypothetical protein